MSLPTIFTFDFHTEETGPISVSGIWYPKIPGSRVDGFQVEPDDPEEIKAHHAHYMNGQLVDWNLLKDYEDELLVAAIEAWEIYNEPIEC